MAVRLVGDIGGTHSRFALVSDAGEAGTPVVFRNSDYRHFDDVLRDFHAELEVAPDQAAFAVAGPVSGNRVHMTNLGWLLDADALCKTHGFDHCDLMNDFAAQAWATLSLTDADLVQLGGGDADPAGNRAILGPGTGLGVSGLVHSASGWSVVAGEGGHVSMPARTRAEQDLIADVVAEYGHCSAERLLSGPGLARIYAHLTDRSLPPESVTAQATAGEAEALESLAMFFELLGTLAADLALTLGARGGVYLTGGILPRLTDEFARSGFRHRFEDKARLGEYLASVPTYLVTAEHPSLQGLAGYMQRN